MTEIVIVVSAVVIIAHNEWRYRRIQEAIDTVGTMTGELCDMQKLRK